MFLRTHHLVDVDVPQALAVAPSRIKFSLLGQSESSPSYSRAMSLNLWPGIANDNDSSHDNVAYLPLLSIRQYTVAIEHLAESISQPCRSAPAPASSAASARSSAQHKQMAADKQPPQPARAVSLASGTALSAPRRFTSGMSLSAMSQQQCARTCQLPAHKHSYPPPTSN